VPEIPTQYPLNPIFDAWGKPWRDLGYTTAYFSLAAVGFAYFLPSNCSSRSGLLLPHPPAEHRLLGLGAPPEAMPLYPTSVPTAIRSPEPISC